MAQRMMYPTNQQAYLPLAVQYQPQYDPAFTQMMAQNLQQTQQRHDVVNAQIAEDMARRGEMFSYDPEYQQEVLGAYREDLDKIAKDYGFNYAQAASKLVSRIGEEALNPFYNLNKYKVQEAERAAQLRAQFGPEAIILNDPMATPITSGSKVEDFRADIIRASDYATVADRLGKDLKGTLTALGLSENEKFKSMLQYGSVERLTPDQIRALANDPDVIAAFRANAPTTALDNREGFEWTQSDEGIANFLYGNWAQKAYERQNLSYTQNPEWAAAQKAEQDRLTRSRMPSIRLNPSVNQESLTKELDARYKNSNRAFSNYQNLREQFNKTPGLLNALQRLDTQEVTNFWGQKKAPSELGFFGRVFNLNGREWEEFTDEFGLTKEEGAKMLKDYNEALDDLEQLSEQSPIFKSLATELSTGTSSSLDGGLPGLENLMVAADIAKQFEMDRTFQLNAVHKIEDPGAQQNIISMLTSYPIQEGRIEMQKTDGTIKTMNKIKDVNSHRNLVVNNPSRLGNMEIVPGTGELRISVKGEGSNPPFTIVLPPSGYEQLKQPLEQFASLYKKVNGAEDAELNSPTQAEFLGIPFNYFHTLSPDGSRIESYGYYGEGPITSNTQLVPLNELMTDLTIYLTNSFTTSAGYEEDVRSLQVDTFRD